MLIRLKNKVIYICMLILLPFCATANETYSSVLINQSNQQPDTNGYKLIKTKMWPSYGCIIDSGKEILYPGERTTLKIKNNSHCQESGIGYSIYKMSDQKNEHLLGYLSHRLGAGKFSIQVSRFCEGEQCVFRDLNPEQDRASSK